MDILRVRPMEIVIFKSADILAIWIFLSLTALPFLLLGRYGKYLTSRFDLPHLKWLLPLAALMVIGLWLIYSINAFQTACRTARGIEVFTKIQSPPVGFSIAAPINPFDDWHGLEFGHDVKQGIFQFVDVGKHRRCASNECDMSAVPQFSVHVLNERAKNLWWHPPLYESTIELRDIQSDGVLAKATDIVFGGGLIGKYMRLLGGDQDFEHISCGYASSEIGPWRPSLASRPRVNEYARADTALLLAPFGGQ